MSVNVGVYRIVCKPTGKLYVGSTHRHFGNRFRQHKYHLRRGDHHSPKLQAVWDKYGEAAFLFEPMIICSDNILEREQWALDHLEPELNIVPVAGSSVGHKLTDEQIENLKRRPQSIAKRYMVKGEMLSVPEMSEKYGVKVVTIRARLREGVTGDDLVKPVKNGVKTCMVGGEELTLKEIAARAGLPLTTVHTRVRSGWTGNDLLRPRLHRGRNSK